MLAARIPDNELERLQSLYALNVLDTPAEARFDRITELVVGYFNVDAALINFIDRDRQWAKSCVGLDAGNAPRHVSFCAYTILQATELVIEDAMLDERFHDNPFVTGDFGLRFYAGHPLCTPNGAKVGSLCLAHAEPRAMSEADRRALRHFASLVEDELNRIQLRDAMEQLTAAEQALERERAQLRTVIDSAPIAIALLDANRRFVAHSAALVNDFNLLVPDVIGQRIDDVLPESAERWRAIHGRLMDGERLNVKEECMLLDGKAICLQWAAVPFYGPEGVIDGAILVIDRIDELVEAREAALNATRLKGEFLARMSHEIRTPMNGVIGMLDMLIDTSLSDVQHEFATLARDSSHQLLTIINDILDFSKIEAGKLTVEAFPFELRKNVEDTVNLLRTSARSKGLDLRIDIAPDVPSRVIGDGHRLRQVMLNLISNALKFTSQGFVEVRVVSKSRDAGKLDVSFAVRDTGIGLSAEAQQRLFRPFEQAEKSTGRHYGGTGLGLLICKELVEMMGGTIAVESSDGQGSTFRFDLPFSVVADPPIPVPVEPSTTLRSKLACLPILLVDDNAVNRRLAMLQIEKLGYNAVAVDDGAKAVEAVRSGTYGLVLMDYQMPIMDGYTATTTIRDLERGTGRYTPIVAMTASVMASEREACLAAGMDDFVSKPIRLNVLQTTIERWAKPAVGNDLDSVSVE